VVTNAGGPGVLDTDMVVKEGGEISRLSEKSIDQLNEFLPTNWIHSNRWTVNAQR
jgi:acetyltransferase